MNLMEELEKDKIKEESNKIGNENQNELKKIFIEYIKENKISQEDENKILDELQNCIDKKSYDNSVFKEELEYCDKWYYKEFKHTFNVWRKVRVKDSNYQNVITELESITSLPKAVQLVLEEIEGYSNFINYNKFLKENNIEQLKNNYSIEELEDTIVSIIKKNREGKLTEDAHIFKGFCGVRDISVRGECFIPELFYDKDKEYFALENQRMEFKDIYWPQAIYIKSLLRNRKIIPYNMAIGYNNLKAALSIMNDLMKCNCNLKKYDIGKNNFVIYENLSEDEVKNQIHLIDVERTKRNNIAKLLLEPIVNKILYEFKESGNNESYNGIEGFKQKKYRLEQLLNNDLKQDIQDKKILQIYGISTYSKYYNLLIIDNCFFAKVSLNYGSVTYGSFSDKDVMEIYDREEVVEGKIDVSVPLEGSEKASIVGRTIIGQALGGTTGGIIGAYSAIEENNRREELIRNQKPIIHNYSYTVKEKECNIILFYNYENFTNEGKREKNNTLYLDLDKNTLSQEEIENIIEEIKLAQSKEVLDNSEIILNYFDENGLEEFEEENLRKYIGKIRKDNYWKEHLKQKEILEKNLEKLKAQEQSMQSEIIDIDNKNKPEIDKIKSKYSCEFEEGNQIKLLLDEITDLNNKSNTMNFLNFIAKNKIKNLIIEKKIQVEQLQVTLKNKKDEVLQKMQPEIDSIEKDKNILKTKLKENLKKQQEIINELEKER